MSEPQKQTVAVIAGEVDELTSQMESLKLEESKQY